MRETADPPETPPEAPPETPPPDDGDNGGDDEVGRLRRENAKHRREARAAQQEADRLRAAAERQRVENESEQERAIREAVETARAQWDTEHAAEQLHSRLRVRAAGKLRDPDDAVLHLGGTLDAAADNAAIDEAIDELIKQRDYLAAPAGNGPPAGGLVTQGARSTAPGSGGREATPDDWIRARARS